MQLLSDTHTSIREIPLVGLSIQVYKNTDEYNVELNVVGCPVDILGTNCDQCVSMVQCCFTSTETIRLVRTGVQDGHLDFHTAPEL